MSARTAFRPFTQSARNYQSTFRSQFRQQGSRRHQTTSANPGAEAAPGAQQSTFQRLWNSPVGVKTVHFWAPVMKWGVVLAGVGDFFRPAEKLSLTQNLALMATGSIWTRWCFVIKPKNMLLAAVNFCLFCVGTIQVSRILTYQASQKGSLEAGAKEMGEELKESAGAVEKKAEAQIKA